MAEERIGFFQALFRFFTFWKLRKSLGLVRAADKQFTSSAAGISDAFDISQDKMVKQYKDLRSAIAEVENVAEQKRIRLENLNTEEQDLIGKREGALTKAEAATEAGDEEALAKHTAAFERFDKRINEIESTQANLENEISGLDESMKKYMYQLTAMQSEIEKMPIEKAEAIAQHVSAKKIIELNDRLSGIQTSMDKGPLDAVRKANQELSAKARISEKIAGTDVKLQDEEYAAAGSSSTSKDRMSQMLAARRAEKDAKTGATEKKTTAKKDRPKI